MYCSVLYNTNKLKTSHTNEETMAPYYSTKDHIRQTPMALLVRTDRTP